MTSSGAGEARCHRHSSRRCIRRCSSCCRHLQGFSWPPCLSHFLQVVSIPDNFHSQSEWADAFPKHVSALGVTAIRLGLQKIMGQMQDQMQMSAIAHVSKLKTPPNYAAGLQLASSSCNPVPAQPT